MIPFLDPVWLWGGKLRCWIQTCLYIANSGIQTPETGGYGALPSGASSGTVGPTGVPGCLVSAGLTCLTCAPEKACHTLGPDTARGPKRVTAGAIGQSDRPIKKKKKKKRVCASRRLLLPCRAVVQE